MKKFFFILIFVLSIILKPITIYADTMGIEFKDSDDDFFIFTGCSEEFQNAGNPIKFLKNRSDRSWGLILDGVINESDKKNWNEYVDFFKNCKKITPPGQSGFAQEYEYCNSQNYYIPKDISKWKEYCGLAEVSERVEITIPVTEEKEFNNNKYAEKEIIDAVAIFDQEVNKITKFVEGDYRRIKARSEQGDEQFSDETLLQKKDVIKTNIQEFKEAFQNSLELIIQINTKLCGNQTSGCDIQSNKDSYDPPTGGLKMWTVYLEKEKAFHSKKEEYKYIANTVNELFDKQITIAENNQNFLRDQEKQQEEQRKKEEDQRKKEDEQRKKEEEQREKEKQEKNNKTKKQFSEIINSIETLENEDYANLLNRIEQLSDLELSTNLETNLSEINNRIDQENEIKKEISDLSNKYKKLKNSLESQKFLDLGLPVYDESEKALAAAKNTEKLNGILDQQIDSLKSKKAEINKKINSDKTWNTVFDALFYVFLLVVLGLVGLLSYRYGKNSIGKSNESENNVRLRELNLKIKLLEEQNSNLEKIISKNLERKKDDSRIISSEEEQETSKPTEEELQAKKDKERSMAYDDALENPNLISKFVNMYGVVGLDKASKVIKGENAILKRDDKAIEKCNFWGMPNPNPKNTSGDQWIIFPGRTLQSNAAALIADDSRYGRELLNGIFKFEVGSTFRVIGLAIAIKEQDGFRIVSQGNLVLPK